MRLVNRIVFHCAVVCMSVSVALVATPSMAQEPAGASAVLPDKFQYSIGSQAAPGQFNAPTCVAVGPDSTVYVLDRDNHRVQRFDANGIVLDIWGSYGSGDGQFAFPEGMAVSPTAIVYVSDTGNTRVQYFTADGRYLGQWSIAGLYSRGTAFQIRGITVGPGGVVYLTDHTCISRFTAGGTFLSRWCPPNWDYVLHHIAVGGDGSVYATYNQGILHLSPTGENLGAWGPRNWWAGIARAADGTFYVAANYGPFVAHLDAEGAELDRWGAYGDGDGEFSVPSGVAVAPDGAVYTSELGNNRIQKLSATGTFLAKWGSQGTGPGQLAGPAGVAVAPDGSIYVADRLNSRVLQFSSTGQPVRQWGSAGSGDGQFGATPSASGCRLGPAGVAVGPTGDVFVLDPTNSRVQQFTATGEFVRKWGFAAYPYSLSQCMVQVAVSSDATVYVLDERSGQVQYFAPDGTYLGQWLGHCGSAGGSCFLSGGGLAVAPNGAVYVGATAEVQCYSPTGNLLARIGSTGNGNGQFIVTGPVAVDDAGAVYALDRGRGRVQAFDSSGQFVGKWGSLGTGPGQFDARWVNNWPCGLEGIAAGTDGRVYVSDTAANRVEVFGTVYLQKWHAEYYANPYLAGGPPLVRDDTALSFDWGAGSPGAGVPADGFSVRWVRPIPVMVGGVYRFTVRNDGGIRLRVDGKLIVDKWSTAGVWRAATGLKAGWHRVEVEYRHLSGNAAVSLEWDRVPTQLSLPAVQKELLK